jgi:hypothetical protein
MALVQCTSVDCKPDQSQDMGGASDNSILGARLGARLGVADARQTPLINYEEKLSSTELNTGRELCSRSDESRVWGALDAGSIGLCPVLIALTPL